MENTVEILKNNDAVQTYLEPQMIRHFTREFETEEKYIKFMSGLWKLRDGLGYMVENQPQLREQIKDMYYSLNNTIGNLLPSDVSLLTKISDKAKGII